jgi:hypothetical protein
MNKRILIPGGLLLLLAGAGAFLYFGTNLFVRATPPPKPPPIETNTERQAIPVPSVPFTDVTDAAHLHFKHHNGSAGKKLLPETMGSGVCVLDFDGDGLQDLLFVSGCAWPGHKVPEKVGASCLVLYRNKGDGTFEDVTAEAGLTLSMYCIGACSGDFDNDGFPDLFITGVGGCRLFKNVPAGGGKRKFMDVTESAGIASTGKWPDKFSAEEFLKSHEPIEFATSATFVDYDGDGKLDIFVCHYVKWSPAIDLSINSTLTGIGRAYLQPQQFEGSQCTLYHNLGNGKFEDVSEAAGVRVIEKEGIGPKAKDRPVGKSLAVIICDPDGDGWPDLIVANDTVRNFFFHNVPAPGGGRKFEEKGMFVNVAYAEGAARGAMGIDWGEYVPGKRGAVIANFANEPLTFLTVADSNSEKLRFRDSALAVGLTGPSKFWLKFGTFFFDYDLDGRLDLLVCNGHLEPEISKVQANQQYAQPPQLFWNTGLPDRVFEEVKAADSGKDLFQPIVGRGCAYLDYNGDGALDVVLVENNGRARLLRNDTKLGNKYARLTLVGDGKTSNTSAIGAQVTIEIGSRTLHRDVAGARGYLSQSELPITVGMGTDEKIDKVTVRWPGKDIPPQVFTNLKANTSYTLRQGKAEPEVSGTKK